MPSLFNDYFAYTEEATNIATNVHLNYSRAFDEYIELGYNPREVAYVITEAVMGLCTEKTLLNAAKKYKAKREDDKAKKAES